MATVIEYPGTDAQAAADLNAKIVSLYPNVPAALLQPIENIFDLAYTTGVAHDGGYQSTAALNAYYQLETATNIVGVAAAISTLYPHYGLIA